MAATERRAWLGTVIADSLPTCVLRSIVEKARPLACSFSLYLFLYFLSQRELENVLESSRKRKKKVEKERARERKRERFCNQVEKEKEVEKKRRGWR